VRLTAREKTEILSAVRRFDRTAGVFLFGSRVNDEKKGGDIDLLILSRRIGTAEKRRIRRMICDAIGDQRIDIISAADTTDPMVSLARSSGVLLQ
jgi:predicted nucleotidyltransferase